MSDTKPVVPTLEEAVNKINALLVGSPHALTVDLVSDGGRHEYKYRDASAKAKKIRTEVSEILNDLWQHGGAFNFHMIAEQLRVNDLDVQAILDIEFGETVK